MNTSDPCSSLLIFGGSSEGPLHDHSATTYDIVRDSILNSSKYFHVVDGLVLDIMHDVLDQNKLAVISSRTFHSADHSLKQKGSNLCKYS